MELGLIVKNTVIVGVVLGAAYLSQQPWSQTNVKTYVYGENASNVAAYIKNTANGLESKILPANTSVSGEVAKNQAVLQQQISAQGNTALQNSVDGAKKFVAGEVLNVLGVTPQQLGGSCPAN